MKPRSDPHTRLVYTSDGGSVEPDDKAEKAAASGDGVVRVRPEKQGRKGKTVTTVTGAPLVGAELKALAKELKKKCGSGGSVVDGVVEIQGDHVDAIIKALEKKGWEVKRSGG